MATTSAVLVTKNQVGTGLNLIWEFFRGGLV